MEGTVPCFSPRYHKFSKAPSMPALSLLTKARNPEKHNEVKAIDIVSVHGIYGNAYDTWRAAGGVSWLHDFIPKDIRHARVFTFDYNSFELFSRPRENLPRLTSKFLEEVKKARTSVPSTRPLVFVCHSMGGLVVEEVCNISTSVVKSLH